MIFENRMTAGRQLGDMLRPLRGDDVIVLGLPRGGVVTAAEVAHLLNAPLGVLLVRKIGHPFSSEFALGAVAEDDEPIYDRQAVKDVDPTWLKLEETAARELIEQRREMYSDHSAGMPALEHKVVVLVDDGIATGLTMKAAVLNVRKNGADRIIVAAPVAAADSIAMLRQVADDVIVIDNPAHFKGAVGAHYRQFDQVDDLEVRHLLTKQLHYAM